MRLDSDKRSYLNTSGKNSHKSTHMLITAHCLHIEVGVKVCICMYGSMSVRWWPQLCAWLAHHFSSGHGMALGPGVGYHSHYELLLQMLPDYWHSIELSWPVSHHPHHQEELCNMRVPVNAFQYSHTCICVMLSEKHPL